MEKVFSCPFLLYNGVVRIIEIFSDGSLVEKDSLRKDIAEEFELHSRDLRPVFSVKQLSTISPRKNAIILNLGDVKIIVGKNKAMFFNAQSEEMQIEFLPKIAEKILETENPIFEFLILEFSLGFSYEKMRGKFLENEINIQKIFLKFKKNITDQYFEALLNIKKHLSKLEIAVKELEEATEEILRDEKEVELMCLSGKKHTAEIESILEHAWEQFEDLSHRIHELNENIDDTQEIITLKMANRRNEIIRFELVATLVTAILSGLAVVVGAFGMNLNSRLESSTFAFYSVILLLFLLFFGSLFLANRYLRKKKIW